MHLQGDTVEEQQLAWSVFLLEADMYAVLDDVWNGEHSAAMTPVKIGLSILNI